MDIREAIIYKNIFGGGGSVDSVNGQTGEVVLTASDVGALPDNTPIPSDAHINSLIDAKLNALDGNGVSY